MSLSAFLAEAAERPISSEHGGLLDQVVDRKENPVSIVSLFVDFRDHCGSVIGMLWARDVFRKHQWYVGGMG